MGVDKAALVKFLRDRGYETDCSMDSHIELWKSWYRGKADFHKYKLWNGLKMLDMRMSSLQLGKSIPEQLANLLFNEKCIISIHDNSEAEVDNDSAMVIEGGVVGSCPTAQFVKNVFNRNDLYSKINECQEKKAAYGTVAYIPYYAAGRIKVNYILADNMIPLSWENGIIHELCVFSKEVIAGAEYVFAQLFLCADREEDEGDDTEPTYIIENLLLKLEKARSGGGAASGKYVEVENFDSLPGYRNIERRVNTGSATRPFVIDKLNIANNINPESPFGLAVYANAIDSMEMCDIVFDSYKNEFVLGRKRIVVAPEAIENMDGNPAFDPNESVFFQVASGISSDGRPFIQEMNMNIRAAEHKQAQQDALNTCSYQCGLGDNFFRYTGGGLVTATQVVSEQNVMFRSLKKHETVLEAAVVDLVHLFIEMGIRYGLSDDALNPEAEIKVKFDDSIIEDKDQEIKRRMAEVSSGVLKPETYLAWRYGISIADAKKMMPDTPQGSREEGMQ